MWAVAETREYIMYNGIKHDKKTDHPWDSPSFNLCHCCSTCYSFLTIENWNERVEIEKTRVKQQKTLFKGYLAFWTTHNWITNTTMKIVWKDIKQYDLCIGLSHLMRSYLNKINLLAPILCKIHQIEFTIKDTLQKQLKFILLRCTIPWY